MTLIQPGNERVVSTGQLTDLIKAASEAGYNRQLDPAVLPTLDPEGVHLLVPMMVHEHIAGKRADPHMRCHVYLKQTGNDLPVTGWLDVDVDGFDMLPQLREYLETDPTQEDTSAGQ